MQLKTTIILTSNPSQEKKQRKDFVFVPAEWQHAADKKSPGKPGLLVFKQPISNRSYQP